MKVLFYKAKDAASHKELGRTLQDLPDGEYVITVKRNKPVRSLSQNKFYHLMLNIIGLSTGHSHEELHEAMKLKFNYEMIHFPKGGAQIVGKSTSNMDTAEFTAYINRVKQWALDEFEIVIPEAKDVDYKIWIDVQNKYNESVSGF